VMPPIDYVSSMRGEAMEQPNNRGEKPIIFFIIKDLD
jgi:hypothetical protein